MNSLNWQLTPPPDFYKNLHQVLPSRLEENKLILSPELGSGSLTFIQAQNELWTQQIEFKTFENLELRRIPNKKNDFFIIDFYLSNSVIIRESDGKVYKLGIQNISLFLTSSTSNALLKIPAHQEVRVFNIIFTRDWLFKNVLTDHPNLIDFFSNDSPIYVSENLDHKLCEILNRVDFEKNSKLTSIRNVLQIIDYLFNRVKCREKLYEENIHLHPEDLDNLLKVNEYLDAHIHDEIRLEKLANMAGMSLSKFKRLYKQLFGTTPYQYYLANKMEKSMELIKKNIYSISEIGFLMGYSNLSQFSKAFKNHFGILPSEVNI
ncbi:MAG: helix-turn-helix transcriptional regulator [Moheibacter sp.]